MSGVIKNRVRLKDPEIGDRFGKDNQLVFIGWDGTYQKTTKLFTVKCEICEKDPELFGDAHFKILKVHLIAGGMPCGCSKYKWSREQYVTKIKRICAEKNYTFKSLNGWPIGKAALTIRCNHHEKEWTTNSPHNFLQGNGCHYCKLDNLSKIMTKPDSVQIESFRKNTRLPEGTVFWRSPRLNFYGAPAYWYYNCPICSYDKYVQAGVCDGIFETSSSSLQQQGVACRCSKTYRWTKEQREFQIDEIIASEDLPYIFIGWPDEELKNKTRMTFRCLLHGNFDTNCITFINSGSRCPSCSKYGFSKNKPATLYLLDVVGRDRKFCGFGITNYWTDRLKTHTNSFKKLDLYIDTVYTWSIDGHSAAKIEKSIKNTFPITSQKIPGFNSEACEAEFLPSIKKYVESKLGVTHGTP